VLPPVGKCVDSSLSLPGIPPLLRISISKMRSGFPSENPAEGHLLLVGPEELLDLPGVSEGPSACLLYTSRCV